MEDSNPAYTLALRVTQYRLAIETAARYLASSDCSDSHCMEAADALQSAAAPGQANRKVSPNSAVRLNHTTVRSAPSLPSVCERCQAPEEPPPAAQTRRTNLSKRELQVLAGITHGETNGEIGKVLFVSINTVKTHTTSLFHKLGVHDRASAVAVGIRRGLVA